MPQLVGSEPSCPECDDRGWVIEDDGGAGTARACDCRRRAVGGRLIAASGVPARYGNCGFQNFQVSAPEPAVRDQLLNARRTAEHYVEHFQAADGSFRESGLLFVGPPGVGKTHLAVAVLLELMRRYHLHGRFADFTTLIHQIQATFDPGSPDSKREILDPVTQADILVLDELGAQKPTPWVQDILYLIINTRYTQRRPTLFTTNYRLDAPAGGGLADDGPPPLERRIPAPLLSRLYEMTQPVLLDAVYDHRREIKRHQHQVRW